MGTAIRKEVSQCTYYGYPIISFDNDVYHECHSVEVIETEVCNIADFLMGKE